MLWGLKLFPTTTGCNVTESLDVPVAVSNLNPIVNRVRGNVPAMGTEGSPLDLGIKTAARALRATVSLNPRYLILATDVERDVVRLVYMRRNAEACAEQLRRRGQVFDGVDDGYQT